MVFDALIPKEIFTEWMSQNRDLRITRSVLRMIPHIPIIYKLFSLLHDVNNHSQTNHVNSTMLSTIFHSVVFKNDDVFKTVYTIEQDMILIKDQQLFIAELIDHFDRVFDCMYYFLLIYRTNYYY
jgi:hypothetical protein